MTSSRLSVSCSLCARSPSCECLGLWAQFFQGPYIPPKDIRAIVFAAYSRTAGAHLLSLATNGLPTDRTYACWRLYHLMPKLFRQKFPHIVVHNLLDHVAFLDYSSISISGKLGKGKDAPQVLLAKNASYGKKKLAQAQALIDCCRAGATRPIFF